MKRLIILAVILLALTACTAAEPLSPQGLGLPCEMKLGSADDFFVSECLLPQGWVVDWINWGSGVTQLTDGPCLNCQEVWVYREGQRGLHFWFSNERPAIIPPPLEPAG